MTLTKRDVGKRFTAPSGEEVRFIKIEGDMYHFENVRDKGDGLILPADQLFILERVKWSRARRVTN
jgi:hypothetical protein